MFEGLDACINAVDAPIDLPQREKICIFFYLLRKFTMQSRSRDYLRPRVTYSPPLIPLPEQSKRQTLQFDRRSWLT